MISFNRFCEEIVQLDLQTPQSDFCGDWVNDQEKPDLNLVDGHQVLVDYLDACGACYDAVTAGKRVFKAWMLLG